MAFPVDLPFTAEYELAVHREFLRAQDGSEDKIRSLSTVQ